MTHEMALQEEYYNKILKGSKIYEIRLNDEKRQLLHVGDVLVFKKEPKREQSFATNILGLEYYKTFSDLLNNISLAEIGFEGKTSEQVMSLYRQFYSAENEEKYGVVAIRVQVIS